MVRLLVRCALVLSMFLPAPAAAQTLTSCTTISQTLFVRDAMADIYYWNTEIPQVNAAQFNSPEAYLDRVRYRPLDESFSYIGSRAESDAYYSDSQFIAYSYSPLLWVGASGYFGASRRIWRVTSLPSRTTLMLTLSPGL
jgi:hypothetical protein